MSLEHLTDALSLSERFVSHPEWISVRRTPSAVDCSRRDSYVMPIEDAGHRQGRDQ